jgi:outer membrane protein assembly factor BamB
MKKADEFVSTLSGLRPVMSTWLDHSNAARRVLVALFSLTFVVAATAAADWPSWRGPTGQGICDEKDLPLTWGGKDETAVLWKVPLPGVEEKANQDRNQSSPIVAKERVFLTTSYWPNHAKATEQSPAHHVACYQLSDGKPLWDVTVPPGPWKLHDLRGGYTAPTPASDGERIYVVFGSSVIAALDFDGKIAWRKEIKPYDFDVAIGTSPIVYGDTILFQCDQVNKSSRLIAFDRKTGDIKWEEKRPTQNFSHSTPVLAKIKDKPQLLVAASNALQGVDPGNGKVLWWCAAAGDTVSPVYGGGLVYCDSGRGGAGVAVDPTGAGDVTKTNLKWKVPQVPDGFSSPIIVGEYVYRVHNPGILKCWKLDSGETVINERLGGVSTASSPFATPDGRIYFASAGKSYVLKAGPKLDVLATNDLGDPSEASPAVSEGKIILKGSKYLYCIGKK